MKRFFSIVLGCVLSGSIGLVFWLPLAPGCLAQSGRSKAGTPTGTTPDARPAQALYEEANNYITKKYQDFNRDRISFDPKLEAATRQEQKDLAARNAATLAARASLAGNDLYY